MLFHVRAAFLGVLSCRHAKELFSHLHPVSVRSSVRCSPSLQGSLLGSSFIHGVRAAPEKTYCEHEPCTGETETLSRMRD